MNIAIIGYGKMGKMVEEFALKRNHQVTLKVDLDNRKAISNNDLRVCDVAVEFTEPGSAVENVKWCIDAKIPVVVGTTGWYDRLEEVKRYCLSHKGSVLYASNFSVGVNIFFALNEYLAKIMNDYTYYDPVVEETHHIHKLDSPSGTAISIANGILQKLTRKKQWKAQAASDPEDLPIVSFREGEVTGIHVVKYKSDVDDIEIKHIAHNRKGFALGAVMAAEWLVGKQGFFSIRDVYQFSC